MNPLVQMAQYLDQQSAHATRRSAEILTNEGFPNKEKESLRLKVKALFFHNASTFCDSVESFEGFLASFEGTDELRDMWERLNSSK